MRSEKKVFLILNYFAAEKKSKNFMEENKKTVKELNTTLQSLKLNLTPNSVPKRPPTPEKYKNVESKVGQLIRVTIGPQISNFGLLCGHEYLSISETFWLNTAIPCARGENIRFLTSEESLKNGSFSL